MGQIAELASQNGIEGKVAVTDEKGVTRTFPDAAEAEEFVGGRKVTLKRGGFFCQARAELAEPPPTKTKKKKPSSSRRRAEDSGA